MEWGNEKKKKKALKMFTRRTCAEVRWQNTSCENKLLTVRESGWRLDDWNNNNKKNRRRKHCTVLMWHNIKLFEINIIIFITIMSVARVWSHATDFSREIDLSEVE